MALPFPYRVKENNFTVQKPDVKTDKECFSGTGTWHPKGLLP